LLGLDNSRTKINWGYSSKAFFPSEVPPYFSDLKVISYMEKDMINMKVTKKFPLKEAAAAHEWIESRQSVGKVLLIP
jgi:NADPH:quinone reductase-like Zn-dependent oxidoreductase